MSTRFADRAGCACGWNGAGSRRADALPLGEDNVRVNHGRVPAGRRMPGDADLIIPAHRVDLLARGKPPAGH